MKPHRRQFLIGPREIQFCEDVKFLSLSSGHYLSYEKDLPVFYSEDRSIVLVGHAICSVTGLAGALLVNRVVDIKSDTSTWVGRWMLYYKGELFSDVTTALSLFYPQSCSEFWVSSSASLLSKVVGDLKSPQLLYKENNFLAPTTCVEGVGQVVIGEKVDLINSTIVWQGFSPIASYNLNKSEILEVVSKRLQCAAENICKSSQPVYSALTSGQDSRLDLASLLSSSADFATFTFVKLFLFMNSGDRDLPEEMARVFKFKHLSIRKGSIDSNFESLYLDHCWTFRSTEPGSPFYYLKSGYWRQLSKGAINIDHCYEIGRQFLFGKGYLGKTENFTIEDLRADGYIISKEGYDRLMMYYKYITSEFHMDRRDFMYLYKSYPLFGKLFQAQDLWVDSMFLGNSREIFSLLLSVHPKFRMDGVFHRELVKTIYHPLADFPYNPQQPIWQKIFIKIVNAFKR